RTRPGREPGRRTGLRRRPKSRTIRGTDSAPPTTGHRRRRAFPASRTDMQEEAPRSRLFENFEYDAPGNSPQELRRALANRLLYSVGKDPATADQDDWYTSLALVTRDRLVERWMDTTRRQYEQQVKRVYYLSMEFLVGRALTNGLMAVGLYDEMAAALRAMGLDIDETREHELDAALG